MPGIKPIYRPDPNDLYRKILISETCTLQTAQYHKSKWSPTLIAIATSAIPTQTSTGVSHSTCVALITSHEKKKFVLSHSLEKQYKKWKFYQINPDHELLCNGYNFSVTLPQDRNWKQNTIYCVRNSNRENPQLWVIVINESSRFKLQLTQEMLGKLYDPILEKTDPQRPTCALTENEELRIFHILLKKQLVKTPFYPEDFSKDIRVVDSHSQFLQALFENHADSFVGFYSEEGVQLSSEAPTHEEEVENDVCELLEKSNISPNRYLL